MFEGISLDKIIGSSAYRELFEGLVVMIDPKVDIGALVFTCEIRGATFSFRLVKEYFLIRLT